MTGFWEHLNPSDSSWRIPEFQSGNSIRAMDKEFSYGMCCLSQFFSLFPCFPSGAGIPLAFLGCCGCSAFPGNIFPKILVSWEYFSKASSTNSLLRVFQPRRSQNSIKQSLLSFCGFSRNLGIPRLWELGFWRNWRPHKPSQLWNSWWEFFWEERVPAVGSASLVGFGDPEWEHSRIWGSRVGKFRIGGSVVGKFRNLGVQSETIWGSRVGKFGNLSTQDDTIWNLGIQSGTIWDFGHPDWDDLGF